MSIFWKTLPFLFVMTSVYADNYQPGREYEKLVFAQPVETGKKIEIREFFWYGCPACYSLESSLIQWLKHKKPKNAAFIRTPSIVNSSWQFHARVFYTLDSMKLVDKLHSKIFHAIHRDKRKLNNLDSVLDFISKHGVDKNNFIKTFKSFGVRLKLKRAGQFDSNYDIHGVPTLVIDGKYRTSASKAGSAERLMKVMEFLINKAARERK